MTTHLTSEQFVEAAEGTLARSELRHLETCEACRLEVAQFSALLGDVRAADVPEPSPLFWDHFSQRVHAATEAEPIPARAWWQDAWRPLATLAVVAAILLAVQLRMPRHLTSSEPDGAVVALTPATEDTAELIPAQAESDDAMEFVSGLASDLSWDDLRMVAQPSRDVTAEALGQLTAAQRAELTRLLKAAMDGAE